MKTTVDAAAFYQAMTALMEIPSKSTVDVLREIKAEFTEHQCVLSATDLDTWMSVTIPAGGDRFSFLFCNSAGIQKLSRHFDGTLEFDLRGQMLTMRSGSRGGEFPVGETKDCPVWPELKAAQQYHANAAKLLACVKQVKYAVNQRTYRPEYRGILFQSQHIWAVDGVRAACCDDGGLDVETPFLVGVPALEQLKAFGGAEIQSSVAEQWIAFQNERIRLLTKRIQNAAPILYEKVLPKQPAEEFDVRPKEFQSALRYLLACAGKGDKPYVRFDGGKLTMRAKNALYRAAIPLSRESSIVFGFDAKLMLDALSQFEKQDAVAIRLTSALGAISLSAGSSSAIVSPVRLKEEQNAA